MVRNNDNISPYQLAMIIIMTLIGAGVFNFIHVALQKGGNDSWFIIGVYGLINIGLACLLVLLNTRFPEKTFPEYIQDIIGVIPGKIVTLLFAAYITCIIAYEVREFTEVAKMFLLPRTPTEIIMITLIFTCVYVVRGGVECVARIAEFTFPILFIPFLLIILPGLSKVDVSNVFPMFQDLPNRFAEMLPKIPHAFYGTEYILFYIGFMRKPKKAYMPVAIGLGFVTGFYIIITLICIMAFGSNKAPEMLWPLLSYIRNINIPGLFIERLDGVTLSLWVITVFTTIVTGYFTVTYSISKVLNSKEHKQYVLPLMIVIFYLALQPDGLVQLYDWGALVFKYISAIFMYAVPLLLLLLSYIRRQGVKKA